MISNISLHKRIETLSELLQVILKNVINPDLKLINKAYSFAYEVHKDQKRISGESYITHILNVAKLIAELKLDSISVACALLHDTVEEGKINLEQIDKQFGTEVAFIINGLTTVRTLTQNYENKDETIANTRDLILNAAEDIRILIIRLAEKLDNVYSLDQLPENIKIRSAEKIINIYGPLCEYLGLGFFKRELEDNAFRIINPEEYKITLESFEQITGERQNRVEEFKEEVYDYLKQVGIDSATIQTRVKSLYSAYLKVKRKYTIKGEKVSIEGFKKLNDILAARIIVNSIEQCYAVLGIVHSKWEYNLKEFDDYIMKPKENGYKSIQTVINYKDIKLEVQIRTYEMHEYNEFGPASHIAYKLAGRSVNAGSTLTWTQNLLNWQKNLIKKEDIYKIKVFAESVFVFTPKGLLIRLPKGSTPIDFAFRIHQDIGLRYQGALVNGKIVPKEYNLNTGDTVEILVANKITVNPHWLKIVKTASARQKIRRQLSRQEAKENKKA